MRSYHMGYIFYNILSMMAFPVLLVALVVRKKYRVGLCQRMGFIPQSVHDQLKGVHPIWIHAVSVGEVIASIPIIKKIKEVYPQKKIVLSTITSTGHDTARQKIPEIDFLIYFPYDFFFIVKKVLKIINPCIFIHTETEIWPNFLFFLHQREIPSVIVNGRISSKSCRHYKLFGWFFKKVFNKVSAFGMQSLGDYQRVIDIGAAPQKVLITGNMKFDQKTPDVNDRQKEELLNELNLGLEDKIFIAGSTHSAEEDIILEVFQQLIKEYSNLVLILAPRHPERFSEVEKLAKKRGFVVYRKSQIKKYQHLLSPQVILMDTIGELAQFYSVGEIIFVGGSLVNIGGHNLLEPLVYKKPVLFGPYIQNVSEFVNVLIESGAGILVPTKDDLLFQAQRLLSNKEEAQLRGARGFQVIKVNQGATEKNFEIIKRFISV
jgi:3-deoxy-D-manno-octulosonic-acid transferase